jgi:hypothetical protein
MILVGLLAAGCGSETDTAPSGPAADGMAESVAHHAASIDDAPDEPCAPLPEYGAAYWLSEGEGRSETYLDGAALCLEALLEGAVVGRRGACTDVYEAYVPEARGGSRDLDGRLDEAQSGRAFGLAYSALVAERTRRSAEGMTGRDYNTGSIFDAPPADSTPPRR